MEHKDRNWEIVIWERRLSFAWKAFVAPLFRFFLLSSPPLRQFANCLIIVTEKLLWDFYDIYFSTIIAIYAAFASDNTFFIVLIVVKANKLNSVDWAAPATLLFKLIFNWLQGNCFVIALKFFIQAFHSKSFRVIRAPRMQIMIFRSVKSLRLYANASWRVLQYLVKIETCLVRCIIADRFVNLHKT